MCICLVYSVVGLYVLAVQKLLRHDPWPRALKFTNQSHAFPEIYEGGPRANVDPGMHLRIFPQLWCGNSLFTPQHSFCVFAFFLHALENALDPNVSVVPPSDTFFLLCLPAQDKVANTWCSLNVLVKIRSILSSDSQVYLR